MADFKKRELSDEELDAVSGGVGGDDGSSLREEAGTAAELVNQIRQDAGLDALNWDQDLEQIASVRAGESRALFSHTRADGSAWHTINSQIQGGESLAFGSDEAQDAADTWMNSPPYRDNIEYSQFTETAITTSQADDGTAYWSEQFGY